jgi:hypothetical protein
MAFYIGDALREIKKIKPTPDGHLDAATLPAFVQAPKKYAVMEDRPVTKTRQKTAKIMKQVPSEEIKLIGGTYTKIITTAPKETDEPIFDTFDLYDEAGKKLVNPKTGQPVKHQVPVMEEYQTTEKVKTGEVDVIERNLGNMISMLTVAVQQLTARIEKLEGK